jgi:1-acyl-sn-glycerol-3-phosphate acyltransferase
LSLIGRVTSVLFSNWLAMVFYALFYTLYDIRIIGLKNYTATPATLITINHKRDLDIPIVASILHLRKTPFSNKRRMYFVAREDLFQPGFLTAHFQIFGLTGQLIHKVNIKPIMEALRAYPISHLIRQRIGPLVRELKPTDTALPMKEVLSPEGINSITEMLGGRRVKDIGDVSIADFLGYSYSMLHQEPVDIKVIQGKHARSIRKRTLKKINQQLHTVTQILDKGGICMLAPEGHLSPDGRFWPVKSGLFRLVSTTSSDIRIIPVNTTYDFMTRGRMRIYMTVGEEFTGVKDLSKIDLEQLVQKSIITMGPVTMSHLGSDFLLSALENGDTEFGEQECFEAIAWWVEKLSEHNVRLEERLLTEKELKRRTRDFLRYCLKKGIVNKKDQGRFIINGSRIKMGNFNKFHENPVQYSVNELKSLLEWHNIERL